MSSTETADRDATPAQSVNLAMWIVLVPTVFALIVKLFTKIFSRVKLGIDDIVMTVSLLFAIGQSIAISQQVTIGFDSDLETLTTDQIYRFLKAGYASQVFYVLSIYLSKLATLTFYLRLCSAESAKLRIKSILTFTSISMFVALLVVLFQCRLPQTWNTQEAACINIKSFWIFNTVIDLGTQFTVALLPIYLFKKLNISRQSKRIVAMLAFVPNLIPVPFAIARIAYIAQDQGTRYIGTSKNTALLSGLHGFIAILAACIPFTKVLIDSFALDAHIVSHGRSLSTQRYHFQGYRIGSAIRGDATDRKNSHSHRQSSSVISKSGVLDQRIRMNNETEQEESAIDLGNFSIVSTKPVISTTEGSLDNEETQSETGSTEKMVIHHTTSATITRSKR